MSKVKETVTVKNISKESQRVLAIPGEEKIKVAKGKEFETTPQIAKQLQKMYPKVFRITSTLIDPAESGPTTEEVEKEKSDLVHGIYDDVKKAILPAVMLEIEDDNVAQSILDGFNSALGEYLDDEHPAFALEIEHVVTKDDLKKNKELAEDGVKVGETIKIPAFNRPAVVEDEEETPVIYEEDGDQWCAKREDFVDLQQSLAGFGNTKEEALADLEKKEAEAEK